MKNLPKLFYTRLERIYSKEVCDKIINTISKPRDIISFRVNNLKSSAKEIEEFLDKNGVEFKKIKELNNAYTVDKKHDYFMKGTEIFYSGKIYIQSLSSMIPAIILTPEKGEIILDMTAAPGSKTTQLADLLNNSGEIHGIEQNQIRFDKLNYNINLQGATNVTTYKMDADKIGGIFSNNYFDKILLDAPCSAEGRINLTNEKTFGFWSTENIKKKQELQIKLLEKAIPLLKKGGTIVYSTCTIAPEENEEVINNILEKFKEIEIEKIELKFEGTYSGITEFNGKKYNSDVTKTLRIIPTNINEGFFVAKLRKI